MRPTSQKLKPIARRAFLLASSSGLMAMPAPSVLRAQKVAPARRNMSAFQMHDRRDHFDSLGKGIFLSDTTTRVLQHWTADGEMRIYPTSVPMTDELTRRGYSEIVYKDDAPDWFPTPSMRKCDPTLPKYVPAGPKNPLGVRTMHLSWQYYRIHGTGDTRKIGRKSSSGCIGLYNEQIIEVFDRTRVETQVKLI